MVSETGLSGSNFTLFLVSVLAPQPLVVITSNAIHNHIAVTLFSFVVSPLINMYCPSLPFGGRLSEPIYKYKAILFQYNTLTVTMTRIFK